jgi:hypothetical protein
MTKEKWGKVLILIVVLCIPVVYPQVVRMAYADFPCSYYSTDVIYADVDQRGRNLQLGGEFRS